MDTTLFKSKSKNKTKIVEVIRHNILEILNENKNTSSISVMEVANKFRTEGQFYLVFKEDKSFIVNVKNNEINQVISIDEKIDEPDKFIKITIKNYEYRIFKELDFDTYEKIFSLIRNY